MLVVEIDLAVLDIYAQDSAFKFGIGLTPGEWKKAVLFTSISYLVFFPSQRNP